MSPTNATMLALTIDALKSCQARVVSEMDEKQRYHWERTTASHKARIDKLMSGAPNGSGIDSGTQLDLERSSAELLVFTCAFHHMHESGMYDGWTEHRIKVRASLAFGLSVQVTGKNKNDIHDHLVEVYRDWLEASAV